MNAFEKIKKNVQAIEKTEADKLQKAIDATEQKKQKKIKAFKDLTSLIIDNIEKISNGDKKTEISSINNKKYVFVYSDKNNIPSELQTFQTHSLITEFKEIYSKESILKEELDIFYQWLADNGFNTLYVSYEHDGMGIRSWNSYKILIQ